MTSTPLRTARHEPVRSVAAARMSGAEAVAKLALAERLRAEAVVGLIDFDAINAHAAEGYTTAEQHIKVLGNVVGREAARLQRVVRFCSNHTLVADALAAGEITVDHADVLRAAAHAVGDRFDDDVLDLLRAAEGVPFDRFKDRVDVWSWRCRPEQTEDEVEAKFHERFLTIQGDIFGGSTGNFRLDAAGSAWVSEALETKPDPANSFAPQRTQGQRRADRLVELAQLAVNGTPLTEEDDPDASKSENDPAGARQTGGRSVDVVIDLPTLLGIPFELDNHRTPDGQVDWSSIQQAFTSTGSAPRPVLAQFFCDASYRQLITSGPRIVLDYNKGHTQHPTGPETGDPTSRWLLHLRRLRPQMGMVRCTPPDSARRRRTNQRTKPRPRLPFPSHTDPPGRLETHPPTRRPITHHQSVIERRWCRERQPNTGLPARTAWFEPHPRSAGSLVTIPPGQTTSLAP